MLDSEEDSCYGFIAHDVYLNCGEPNPDSDFNTPRQGEASRFEVFIDPIRDLERHNILFSCNKAICNFIIPDVFGTMFQFGTAPNGKKKNILFKFQIFDVQIMMLDVLVQGFFYKCLKFIGFMELWNWKDEGRNDMLSQEKSHVESELIPYYANYRLLLEKLNSSSGKERTDALDRVLQIESALPLLSIMHLRRVCGDFKFTSIEGSCDPLLHYSLDCDPQDIFMSRHLKLYRIKYERDSAYIHLFRVEPMFMNAYTVHFIKRLSDTGIICPSKHVELPSYKCSREFILNAPHAIFKYFYRMHPVEAESVERKMSISLSLNEPLLVDMRSSFGSNVLLDSEKRDESENLNFEYWYYGTGGGCMHCDILFVAFPIDTTYRFTEFISFFCQCFFKSSNEKKSERNGETERFKQSNELLLLEGKSINAVVVFKDIVVGLVVEEGGMAVNVMLLQITGSLVLHSNSTSESFSLQIAECVIIRDTISPRIRESLPEDLPRVKWTPVASSDIKTTNKRIFDLTLMTIAFDAEVHDRVGANGSLSWKEYDMIDRANRENLHRVSFSIINIALSKALRDAAVGDLASVQISVDGEDGGFETHPMSLKFPEKTEFEFLVPAQVSGHRIHITINTLSGTLIGDGEIVVASRIHRGSVFAQNGDSIACKLEFKADVSLPLMMICITGIKLQNTLLSEQESEDFGRSMHFIVSVPLPPDCSTNMLLASNSVPAMESNRLRERFLVPCYPGRYFPLSLSMYLEADQNDIFMGSTSIAVSGVPVSGTIKLKEGNTDIAEVAYSYSWFDENAIDYDYEGGSLVEIEGTEDVSTTNEGGLVSPVVGTGSVILRRLRRSTFVELEDLHICLSDDDFIFLIGGIDRLDEVFRLRISSEGDSMPFNDLGDTEFGHQSVESPKDSEDKDINRRETKTDSDFEISGYLLPRCCDFVWESPSIRELVYPYASLEEFLANSFPSNSYEYFWDFLECHNVLSPQSNFSSMSATEMFNVQIKLVQTFQNYLFAKSIWGLIIVPHFSGAPRIGMVIFVIIDKKYPR